MGENEVRLSTENVPLYSVRDIVRRRVLPPKESGEDWHLAIVQRNLVWNEERMARLLDSLLRGYPIGGLLFCKLSVPFKAMRHRATFGDPGHVIDKVGKDTPQLVDGQQRIHSLACIFSDTKLENSFEDFGDFYYRLDKSPVNRMSDTKRKYRHLTSYISCNEQKPDQSVRAVEGKSDSEPEMWLRLGGFLEWDRKRKVALIAKEIDDASESAVFDWLTGIDPVLSDFNALKADENWLLQAKSILKVWFEPRIPAVTISLDKPTDMLEVYIRSNMEGVRVSVEDAFFAAVKISWHETEMHLKNVTDAFPVLDRMSALRILARIARKTEYDIDYLPVSLEPLNEDKGGKRIIDKMEAMSKSEGKESQLQKWHDLLKELRSKLGYSLNFVHEHSFDHVLAWASQHPKPVDSDLSAVAAYLVGSSYYKYYQVLGETFSRLAFNIAFKSGQSNNDFPTLDIIAECCRIWRQPGYRGLKRGLRDIRASETDNEIFWHFRQQNEIFKLMLSIAQRIPFELKGVEIEWEHIYAQALAERMQVKEGKMLHNHADRSSVLHGGNLMAMDARQNLLLSDSYPFDKEEILKELLMREWNPCIPKWSSELHITDDERELLRLVQHELKDQFKSWDDRDDRVNRAMKHYVKYVRGRTMRIWNEVNSRFPELKAFEKMWKDE